MRTSFVYFFVLSVLLSAMSVTKAAPVLNGTHIGTSLIMRTHRLIGRIPEEVPRRIGGIKPLEDAMKGFW